MGHPVQILNTGGSQLQSGGSLNATLHWDGDSLLFTTDQNGNLTDLKVGLLGDLLPSGGISVLERDWSGDVVAGHNAAGSLGISIEDPYQQSGGFGNENGIPDNVFQQGPILQPASDGIWDGVSVIQGVRNHDPQTGSWTTPDAYSGNVHDPMSQKSYMWNRNNAIEYSDPSGFDSDPLDRFDPNKNYWLLPSFLLNFFGPEMLGLRGLGIVKSGIPLAGPAAKGALTGAREVGSALTKSADVADIFHYAAGMTITKMLAEKYGTRFVIEGLNGKPATLIQSAGSVQKADGQVAGIFQYIIDSNGNITKESFVEGGTVNGIVQGQAARL